MTHRNWIEVFGRSVYLVSEFHKYHIQWVNLPLSSNCQYIHTSANTPRDMRTCTWCIVNDGYNGNYAQSDFLRPIMGAISLCPSSDPSWPWVWLVAGSSYVIRTTPWNTTVRTTRPRGDSQTSEVLSERADFTLVPQYFTSSSAWMAWVQRLSLIYTSMNEACEDLLGMIEQL